jgi:hypothetical protein
MISALKISSGISSGGGRVRANGTLLCQNHPATIKVLQTLYLNIMRDPEKILAVNFSLTMSDVIQQFQIQTVT